MSDESQVGKIGWDDISIEGRSGVTAAPYQH